MISGGSSAKLPPPTPGTPGTPGATSGTPAVSAMPAASGAPAASASPATSGAPAAAPQARRVVLTIASRGEIFVDARPISDDALPRTLRDLASRSKDTQLVIRADKNVTAGRVVHVMDQAKQAGLTRIAIAVSP